MTHLQRAVRKYIELLIGIEFTTDTCVKRRRLAFNFPLTISWRNLISCHQQVLLIIKISYLNLVQFIHECTIIVGTTLFIAFHKWELLCTSKQWEWNPSLTSLTFIHVCRNEFCLYLKCSKFTTNFGYEFHWSCWSVAGLLLGFLCVVV